MKAMSSLWWERCDTTHRNVVLRFVEKAVFALNSLTAVTHECVTQWKDGRQPALFQTACRAALSLTIT
jgi:hypothetical protein